MGAGNTKYRLPVNIPDTLDEAACKELTGDHFNRSKFDALKDVSGHISKDEFASACAEEMKKATDATDATGAMEAKAADASSSSSSYDPVKEHAKHLKLRATWHANRSTFQTWLDQTQEEALEPSLEIVDPHHHLWDMRQLGGYNLFGIFKQQYYMTDELVDDMVGCGGHNVTHSVFVTTHAFFSKDLKDEGNAVMAPVGEVQFVQGVAAQFASGQYGPFRGAAGIVGTADLATFGAEVEPLLVACKRASPNYRGIRCTASHDPNLDGNFAAPGMYAQPTFLEGFALLEKHGLSYDAWVFSCQLPEIVDLALAFPTTTIVLNHAGSPVAGLGNVAAAPAYDGKQQEIMDRWKVDMARIATECPNVYVKVGGAGLPQLGAGFEAREKPPTSEEVAHAFKDMYLWTIATFGAERCMLEGNFPVDKVSMSYVVMWNALKRITMELPDTDRALLFSGTAKKVYNL
jgi:predicted TIM-barrel fold metal-dependent hydrolase